MIDSLGPRAATDPHARSVLLDVLEKLGAEDAARMLSYTKCAGVMIGRGALVRPWIFRDCWSYLTTGIIPPKPTLDLEPNYEDHPYNPWPEWDPGTGYFRDYDVRKQLYRSVFAGACGVTYGHHAVWQFAGKRNGVINHADRDWIQAMYRPGACQAVFLRRLLDSRPFFSRIPDQSILTSGAGTGGEHAQATRDRDGRYLLAYFPLNDRGATVDLASIRGTDRRGWWYDPRTGIATSLDQPLTASRLDVVTPSNGPDWVLVIDDAAAGFAPPGLLPT